MQHLILLDSIQKHLKWKRSCPQQIKLLDHWNHSYQFHVGHKKAVWADADKDLELLRS